MISSLVSVDAFSKYLLDFKEIDGITEHSFGSILLKYYEQLMYKVLIFNLLIVKTQKKDGPFFFFNIFKLLKNSRNFLQDQ